MTRFIALICAFSLALPPAHAEQHDPLAGYIRGVSEERFVAFQDMLASIREHSYILIGERHGRHAHQGRETFLIGALAEAGRYPGVAFEMLSHEQTKCGCLPADLPGIRPWPRPGPQPGGEQLAALELLSARV